MPTPPSQATAEGMPIDRAQRIQNTAEQLVKQVKAGNVNTEYDFSDHDAIWQCMRLRSGEKLTREEAVEAYLNAATTAPQIEQYWALQRVNALSKEIAAELSKIEGYHLVIIHPSSTSAYPVSICLDKEFADMLQSVTELRKGAEHAKSIR